MDDTTLNVQVEAKTERLTAAESLKTSHSGGNANTTLTAQDIAKLESLTRKEALAQVCEELAALLVTYHNLGGPISALTLPPGKQIMAHSEILVLPAKKDEFGAYALDVP